MHQEIIPGEKFNRLTVIERDSNKSQKGKHYYYKCVCDCGNQTSVRSDGLRTGTVKSCGCYKIESTVKRMSGNKIRQLNDGEASFNHLYDSYRNRANKKKISFNLTKDQFKKLTRQNCFYCGKPPLQERHGTNYNGSYIYNGIDRVDNEIGYTINNCVTCCKKCNEEKHGISTKIMIKALEFLGYKVMREGVS